MLRLSSLLLLSVLNSGSVQEEARVKALYLYKFMQNMEWSTEKSEDEYLIAVVGDINLLSELRSVTKNKSINNKTIAVVNYSSETELKDINILFLSESLSDLFEDFHQKSMDNSVLLITESSGLGKKGAGVNFYSKDDKIRFEMNLETLEKSKINTSRQIRDIAKLVN